jgi:hypothetical protein
MMVIADTTPLNYTHSGAIKSDGVLKRRPVPSKG